MESNEIIMVACIVITILAVIICAWVIIHWFRKRSKAKKALNEFQLPEADESLTKFNYNPTMGMSNEDFERLTGNRYKRILNVNAHDNIFVITDDEWVSYCEIDADVILGIESVNSDDNLTYGGVTLHENKNESDVHAHKTFTKFEMKLKKTAEGDIHLFTKHPSALMNVGFHWDPTKVKRLQTENVEFNRLFKIYTSNEFGTFYQLTPTMMESIMNFKTKHKCFKISFDKDVMRIVTPTTLCKDGMHLIREQNNMQMITYLYNEFIRDAMVIDD